MHQLNSSKSKDHANWLWWLTVSIAISLTAAEGCPNKDQCKCSTVPETQEIVINCKYKSLTSVPNFGNTDWSFSQLTLAGNAIDTIHENAFKTQNGQGLDVRELDISDNPVTTIHENAFAGLETNLKELVLHVDSMTTFPTNALQRLTNLEKLTVKGFRIPNSLPNDAFSSLNKLVVLNIIDCDLSSLSGDHFQGQQQSLKELNLEDNIFTTIPTSALTPLINFEKLLMCRNQIELLPANSFQGTELKMLDLSQNGITSVNADAFTGLERTLQNLHLSSAQIHSTNLPPLKILQSLQELHLDSNDIDYIPEGLFANMDSLRLLDMHNCKLTRIATTTFAGLDESFEELNLASNRLNNVEDNAFSGLSGLKKIELSGQILTSVLSINTFKGLENNLEILMMNGVKFSTDNWKSVEHLRSLVTLRLYSNDISAIPDSIMRNMNSLEILELQYNTIATVTQSSFRGLQYSLKEINLNNNAISRMDECVFHQFDQLETIKIDNNPLHCDCHTKWMREWLDKYDDFDKDLYKWKCNTPDQHKDQFIKDIAKDALVCTGLDPPMEECEVYTTPKQPESTTTDPSLSGTTTPEATPILVNISDITSISFLVTWEVFEVQNFDGFMVEVTVVETSEKVDEKTLGPEDRSVIVGGLQPSVEYTACVVVIQSETADDEEKDCESASTEPSSGAMTGTDVPMEVILGSVIGVLSFFILLACIIVLVRRHQKNNDPFYLKYKAHGLPQTRSDIPELGYNSKRFSKSASASTMSLQNLNNVEMAKKLEGFSPEERDRILNLITSSGASTLSMVSNASSHRYLHEPLPRAPGGSYTGGASNNPMRPISYLNTMAPDEENEYQEIPVDQYEYIPADAVTKYEYIPADQVVRLDDNQPGVSSTDVEDQPGTSGQGQADQTSKWI